MKEILFVARKFLFKKFKINKTYNYIILSCSDDIFCGYYDITPFSNCGRFIFYNKKKKDSVEIICHDFLLNKEICLGKSMGWSTQLGARIFWLNNSRNLGFNALWNKKQVFLIKEVKTNKLIKKVNHPIFDINKKNNLGLSLDFKRLEEMRPGYGFVGENSLKNSIGIVNLKNDVCKKIISTKELCDFLKIKNQKSSYFNHLSWSPCGEFFVFFFVWLKNKEKKTHFFIYNYKRNKLSQISKKNEVVSHFNWIDKNNLIFSLKKGIFKYVIFNIKNKRKKIIKSFPKNLDGHPSINPRNSGIFVTDTYQNFLGNQKLFLIGKKNKTLIGEFFLPKKYFGRNKNDLHPRWSNDGKSIAVDVAFSGKREIMVLKKNEIF